MMEQNYQGLSEKKAKELLEKYGPNKIEIKDNFRVLKMIASQFTSILIIILIIASLIFFIIGETVDAYVILAIVIVNAVIGFFQEFKASKAVASLKKMLTKTAIVIRDGKQKEMNIENIVPGDIVVLSEGDKIPADMVLLESYSLKLEESILTGESFPVLKKPIKGQDVYLYSGTTVVTGKGKAKVVKTGKNTDFGKIVGLVSKEKKSKSVFEHQLDRLSKNIVIVLSILIVILFILGIFRGVSVLAMFLIVVSLAISAIPEGLPIVITLTLSMGVRVMSKKNAIVRKMSAIESLGSTTVICSDKTGTLTLNEMTVEKLVTPSENLDIKGTGYFSKNKYKLDSKEIEKILSICENNNDSTIEKNKTIGDPTELALKVLARKFNYYKTFPLLDQIPFSSDRKMMSTMHKTDTGKQVYTKGAFDEIIKRCNKIYINGKTRKLTKEDIKRFNDLEDVLANKALRVLGFAYKPVKDNEKLTEKDLIFVGLIGMMDPPRKEVKHSLKLSRKAGIETKIITGDYAITAKAIATEIGIENPTVLDAKELDKLDDKKALEIIQKTNIFARAKPEHKYRIVTLLKDAGEIVSVTGDGVNDAPAIKNADVGIAMGIKGTEATKEVADIVLKDDAFSSIVKAIKEGRRIYDNIILFVKYMLAVNFVMLVAIGLMAIINFPIPLIALQILWINMVTDSLPAVALGRREASEDIMKRPPRRKDEKIFKKFLVFILVASFVKLFGQLILFMYGLGLDASLGINTFNLDVPSYARTLFLTAVVIFELFFAFVINAEGKFTKRNLLSNKSLIYSILIVLALQVFAIYNGFMQEVFSLVPLTLKHWALIILFGLSSIFVLPLTRFVKKITKK